MRCWSAFILQCYIGIAGTGGAVGRERCIGPELRCGAVLPLCAALHRGVEKYDNELKAMMECEYAYQAATMDLLRKCLPWQIYTSIYAFNLRNCMNACK